MNNPRWHIRGLVLSFFEFLLKLYPPRFRREFSSEMQQVVLSRVRSAEELGWMAWLSAVLQEIMGLVPSIFQECWHELSFQKERAMVPGPPLENVSFMKTIAYIRWADPPLWTATIANLLPLWLLGLAIFTTSISAELTGIFFLLSIAVMILLLWLRWFTFDLIFYSFFPIIPFFLFEEISPGYKTPFILFCMFLLSIGIFGYRLSLHKYSVGAAWLILFVVFIGTWMLASNANQNYQQMVVDLGYGCDPFGGGCPAPRPADPIPPWVLFFSP